MTDNIYITQPQSFVYVQVNDEDESYTLHVHDDETRLDVERFNQDTVVVEDNAIRGPLGEAPSLAVYEHLSADAADTLTIDAASATSWLFRLSTDVTTINITGWPANTQSQFVSVYLKQDATGHRSVTGWPASVVWAETGEPDFSQQEANDYGHVMLNSFDGGNTIFATLIAYKYT